MPSVNLLTTRFAGNFKVGQPITLQIPKEVRFLHFQLLLLMLANCLITNVSFYCE